jgi:hypothetical protein
VSTDWTGSEDECYHLTALIETCLQEAEHLVRKVHSKAFNRSIDHDGTKGTVPLSAGQNGASPSWSLRALNA